MKLLTKKSGVDDPLLHDAKVRRETFKNRKLTRHFLEVLLQKMGIPDSIVQKCLKIPMAHYGQVMDLTNKIASGKYGVYKLKDLKTIMCKELDIIPAKLKDISIAKEVYVYLKLHVKPLI